MVYDLAHDGTHVRVGRIGVIKSSDIDACTIERSLFLSHLRRGSSLLPNEAIIPILRSIGDYRLRALVGWPAPFSQ